MEFLILKPSSLGDIIHAFPAVNALRHSAKNRSLSVLQNPLMKFPNGAERIWIKSGKKQSL